MNKLLTIAACTALAGFANGETIWKANFANKEAWAKPHEYSGPFEYRTTPDAFGIGGTRTNKTDTAWQVGSAKVPCARTGKYAVNYKFRSKGLIRKNAQTSKTYDSAIIWYDDKGNEIVRHGLPITFKDGDARQYRVVYEFPKGIAAFSLSMGFDAPNILKNEAVSFSDVYVETVPDSEPVGATMPDIAVPRIRIVSETPTRRIHEPVVVSVSDSSGIDQGSIAVKLDGKEFAGFAKTQSENGWLVSVPAPQNGWTDGIHWLAVTAKDLDGNINKAKKCFLIGDAPKTPKVTLRDDGITLIDGKPFFPIGIYGVCKRAFNAYDFDRALADLKAAGFNTVHSYGSPRDPKFHAMAHKYGLKMWMAAYEPDRAIVDDFRHNDNIIAWYLGDDTSDNTTVEELHDRDDNIRAVDPTRITTQADPLVPMTCSDRYVDYTSGTDNFLPEMYPVHGNNQEEDRACVAQVVLEMKRIAEDQKKDGTRSHSTWPIIQYFKGWGWKRFPTAEELYGMNMAAIICGAHGITWYTYGGFVQPEKNKFNYGVTTSEEVWRNTTNSTLRIASLVPVLVERTPAQPTAPVVTEGPDRDVRNNASINQLYKEKDGFGYLMVVNSADAKVKASLAFPPSCEIEVLWENRKLKSGADGKVTETFTPLAAHVYRFRK